MPFWIGQVLWEAYHTIVSITTPTVLRESLFSLLLPPYIGSVGNRCQVVSIIDILLILLLGRACFPSLVSHPPVNPTSEVNVS